MSETFYEDSVDEMDLDEDPAITYGRLVLLADVPREAVDSIVHQLENEEEDTQNEALEEVETEKELRLVEEDAGYKRLTYKAYEPENIKKFIQLMQEEGATVAKHAKSCFIPRSTAYEILKQRNESDGTVIPTGCKKKPSKIGGAVKANNCKIKQEHTEFLVDLVDKNPCVTVNQAREELCQLFEDLDISASGLSKHMKEKIRLSLKDARTYNMERDALRTTKLRFNIITEWKAALV